MAELSEIATVIPLSPPQMASEPNPLADLSDFERKSLEELRVIVQEALDKQEFSAPAAAAEVVPVEEKETPLPLAAVSEVVEEVAPTQEPKISAEIAKVLVKETSITSAPPAVPIEEKETLPPPLAVASEVVEEIVSTQEPKISAEVAEVLGKGTDIPSSLTELKTEEKETPPPPPPPPPLAVAVTTDPPEIETHTAESEIVEEISKEKPPESVAAAFATDAAEVAELSREGTDITSSPEEVSIWGVPLLKDDRSDVILLKFLRARNFKVKDAFVMLRNTIKWRREFNIDALINEDLGDNLDKVVFMHGFDKEGHPVCYSVYGEFQNRELYQKTFVDEVKRTKFLQWWIQLLERSIRKLDFSPGGICTICQVSNLKNWPGLGKTELKIASRQLQQLHKDNYPEFFAKHVFINAPWWYAALCMIFYPFLPQRTKSKLAFAGQSKTAETLFKYISPEQVPIQYGGLSVDFCDRNPEFSIDDPATEITVEPAAKQAVEIPVNEECIIVWELRVVGWEVSYGAEYVPNEEGTNTVVIQKPKKMAPTDEPVKYAMQQAFKTLMGQMDSQNNQFNNAAFSPGSPFPFPTPSASGPAPSPTFPTSPPSSSATSASPAASQATVTVDVVPATKVDAPRNADVNDNTEVGRQKKYAFVHVSPNETLQKSPFGGFEETKSDSSKDTELADQVSQKGSASKPGVGAAEGSSSARKNSVLSVEALEKMMEDPTVQKMVSPGGDAESC